MVAKSPPKLQNNKIMVVPPPLDLTRIRETVEKVEKSIARLQELQFTVAGGKKKITGGITLSPRSTRGYLKTSLRCKQESLRIKNVTSRRSPPGKLPTNTGDWKRMSLPAMLLGETVGEILQATKFARQIVEAVDPNPNPKSGDDDPKTPPVMTHRKNQRPTSNNLENNYCPELRARRRKEKQVALQLIRTESSNAVAAPPPFSSSYLRRAKSRINFKVSSPPQINSSSKKKKMNMNDECDKENCKYIANRVSPRNKPWARKTVLFPNPVFHTSTITRWSPPITERRRSNQQSPHKFLIKSPAPALASSSVSKFHVKIRSPPLSISPTRSMSRKKSSSPKMISMAAAKLRRSFSPSRLANRLVSPLKNGRKSTVNKIDDGMNMMKMMSGLKQRPIANVVPPTTTLLRS